MNGTVAAPERAEVRRERHPVLAALRVQTLNWHVTTGMPVAVAASALVINLAISLSISEADRQEAGTGALASLHLAMVVAGVQTMTQFLPFALGLSITRRHFYLAAISLAMVLALGDGVALYVLRLAEDATGGWGLNVRFFGVPFLVEDNPMAQVLAYAGPLFLCSAIGLAWGSVQRRWGMIGVWTALVCTAAVAAAGVVVLTLQEAWTQFGHWFADASPLGLLAGWCTLAALPFLAAGYAVLRRTPA